MGKKREESKNLTVAVDPGRDKISSELERERARVVKESDGRRREERNS